MADRGDSEELRRIARTAADAFDESKNISVVGNPVVDAILSHYLLIAKENRMKVTLDVAIPDVLPVSPLSLSILIGNTMDNAIEACRSLPPEQRRIHLQLRKQYRTLFYRLDNPCGEGAGTPRRGLRHGYGLKNVRRVVEECDGDFHAEKKDGHFTVQARLNCQSQEMP